MPDSITLSIDNLSSAQVSQVLEFARSLRSGPQAKDEQWRNVSSTGWKLDHVQILRDRLAARGNDVQLRAFNLAINNDGHVSRDEIFGIGGYEQTRQLKNWTKPLRTIFSELVDDHDLPESAELPMEADYTEGSSFRQAYGFSVAPEIVKLVRDAMCDDCWKLKATRTSGRRVPPHSALERVNDFREVASGGMRADEQDYVCGVCGKNWMHETGNHGMGWVETGV
jgi:hypothetical protein